MRTMTRNKAKGFAVLLSAAMILGTTVMPAVDAKAKKPKLSKTKISIEQGKKAKVTVKNAKKVTWKLTKAGKKIISLSKKSEKGVTIKAKKAGKAKISVIMKAKKKTYKKKLTVTVTKKQTTDTKTTNTNTNTNANTDKATPTPSATPTPTATPTPPSTDTPSSAAPAAYKVDFEKDAKFEDSYCAEQSVSAAGASVTFGQFHGIFYTLPNTEQMQKSNYKYAYITYTSERSELKVSFLNKDAGENGLADPLETYGRQENDLRVEVGTLTETAEEQTLTLTSDDGIATNGVQIFNWGESAELVIKNIVFSEKELTPDELAAVK